MSYMERSLGEDLREVSISFAEDLIDALEGAGMLSCSASAAKQELGISGAEEARVAKPSMLIPFCGEIVEGWCKAVRLNHGLHTQCTNGVDGEEYCSTCSKHAEHSATSKPPYGDIRDRVKFGVDYRDPSGRQTTPYANVAAKMKLDVAKAKVEAAKFGWSIPEEQLVLKERKRGRPKSTKSAAVSDTSSEGYKVSSPQDDLIAKLVMEAADDAASTVSSGSSLSSSQLKKIRAKTVVVASQKTLSDVAVEAKAAKEAAKAAKEAAKAERARVAAEAKAARDAAKAVRDAAKAAKDAERAEKARVAAEAKAAKDAERAEKARVAAEAKAARDAAKAAKVAEQEAAKAAKEAAKAAKEAAKVEKVRLLEEAKAEKVRLLEAAKAAKLAEKEAAKAEKVRLLEEAKAAKLAEKEAAKAAKLAEREAEKEAKKVAVLVEKIKGVRATREALSELPQSQDFPEGSEALKEVLANERKELKKLERAEPAEKPVSGEELQEEASAADAGSDDVTVESEEEDEEDDEITLTSDMKYEHNGVTYFKTTAYGFENMLFSLGGEAVGILDVESGTLQEVSFAEEEDDDLDMD